MMKVQRLFRSCFPFLFKSKSTRDSKEENLEKSDSGNYTGGPSSQLLVVHTERHWVHDPKLYFDNGQMEPYPEQPTRVESILRALKKRQGKGGLPHLIVEPTDFGLKPILAVHSQKYLDYVRTAYNRWILKGGSTNGVIPATYGVHLRSIYRDITLSSRSDNVFAEMGLYTFDASTPIVKDTYIAAYEAAQVALTAAESLVSDKLDSVYALCRPPGMCPARQISNL